MMEGNICFWTLDSCYHVPLEIAELLLRVEHKGRIVLCVCLYMICVDECVYVAPGGM